MRVEKERHQFMVYGYVGGMWWVKFINIFHMFWFYWHSRWKQGVEKDFQTIMTIYLREWSESFYDFCTILKLFYILHSNMLNVDDDRMGIGKFCDVSSHNLKTKAYKVGVRNVITYYLLIYCPPRVSGGCSMMEERSGTPAASEYCTKKQQQSSTGKRDVRSRTTTLL